MRSIIVLALSFFLFACDGQLSEEKTKNTNPDRLSLSTSQSGLSTIPVYGPSEVIEGMPATFNTDNNVGTNFHWRLTHSPQNEPELIQEGFGSSFTVQQKVPVKYKVTVIVDNKKFGSKSFTVKKLDPIKIIEDPTFGGDNN